MTGRARRLSLASGWFRQRRLSLKVLDLWRSRRADRLSTNDQSAFSEGDRVRLHSVFLPFQTYAGQVRNVEKAVFDLVRLLQHRIGPILPFEPVGCLCYAHDVSSDLWIEMGGHWYARCSGDGGCSKPPGDSTDAHEVGHNEVASFLLKSDMEVARSVKVFTDLDGGPQFGGKLGETLDVVVDNRLLDPGKPEIVDDVASLKRFTQMKTLIEIDHQGHVFPDRFAHRHHLGPARGPIATSAL